MAGHRFSPLNEAVSGDLEGGLPCGRIVEIFGPPSAGKTFLATRAMIAAQKVGGIAVFLDHENSFDVGLAEKLWDFNLMKMKVIGSISSQTPLRTPST
ncbi:DNA recombination/repair protein RecA [Klebsiella pneumoniae subsp. pneumoniae]|nr:DNA recombination/repair protein RecA [Klebsiella pneumoniae subsp. pneumoniae]